MEKPGKTTLPQNSSSGYNYYGSGLALSSGTTQCTTGVVTAGTYSIKAIYSGDSDYLARTSATLSQVVE
jgi:hypothetical protein